MLTVTHAKGTIIIASIVNHNNLKCVLVYHPTVVPIISLIVASNIKVC